MPEIMTQKYDHYPLVKKALAEQAGIFKDSRDGMPAELLEATLKAVDLIDTHVTDPFKEDIMAVSVLMNCPPYISLQSKRFATDYSRHVQDMLDLHVARNGITVQNEDLIQVYSALFAAHGANLLAHIKAMTAADEHWLSDVREGIEEYLADRHAVETKIAPGLLAIENELVRDTFAAIDERTPGRTVPPLFKKPRPGA